MQFIRMQLQAKLAICPLLHLLRSGESKLEEESGADLWSQNPFNPTSYDLSRDAHLILSCILVEEWQICNLNMAWPEERIVLQVYACNMWQLS